MKIYTKVILLFSFFCSVNINVFGAEGRMSQKAQLKVGVEQITLPSNETLDWIGTSYLLEVYPDIFIGSSLYGAITGNRGGLFVIGSELTWRNNLFSDWYTDIGLNVGAGGGGAVNKLVGGGLMLRPHIDLTYNFGHYQAGLSISHVRFPYGTISSNQVGLVLSSSSDFSRVSFDEGDLLDQTVLREGFGFDRILGTMATYNGDLKGLSKNERATMLGMRAENRVSSATYWGIEVVGAAQGGVKGYAEYLATFGIEYPILSNVISVGGRVGLGMAGGGGAATKGGLLSKVGVNLTATLSKGYHITLEGGYVVSPQGQMGARYVGADVKLDLNNPFSKSYEVETNSYEWKTGLFNYHTVIAEGKSSSIPLQGIKVGISRFVGDYFYHGFHVMYAAKGGTYGGYGHTFVDLGYRSPEVLGGLSMAAEVAIGGGGGANLSVGGGALYMGNIYLDYKLDSALRLRIGAGRLRSFKGTLDTAVTEAVITYSYALEEHH